MVYRFMGSSIKMKNTTPNRWQRTTIDWGSSGDSWKTNILVPGHPGHIHYSIMFIRSVSVPTDEGQCAVITFVLNGSVVPGKMDENIVKSLCKKIPLLCVGNLDLNLTHDDDNCGSRQFKISMRLKGSFCDEVVDFVITLLRFLGVWEKRFNEYNISTEMMYKYRGVYIDYTQYFKLKRGIELPCLDYITMPCI